MKNCSLQRRLLLVLCALMLLPVVSAFAQSVTFNVTVLDNQGKVVPNAEVTVYDKNGGYHTYSTTGSDGKASVYFSSIYPTADSSTNPSDNIGILVIPNNNANNTELAFGYDEVVCYNNGGTAGFSFQTITLAPGCKLTVNPKLSAAGVVTPGIAANLEISTPYVPSWVKSFNLAAGSINEATQSWQIYWPNNTNVFWKFSSTTDQSDITKAGYYGYESGSFSVANELTKDKDLIHVRKEKGRIDFTGEAGHTYTVKYDDYTGSQHISGYNYLTTVNSSGTVYLPYDDYTFYSIESVATTGNPPVQIFTPVTVSSTTTSLTLSALDGHSVSGHVSLAGNPSFAACDHMSVVAEVEIGASKWFEVQEVTPSTVDGLYTFTNLLAEGCNYRIKARDKYYYYGPGVIDNSTDLKQCYTNRVFAIADLQSAQVVDLELPQAPAVSFRITYPAGWSLMNQQVGSIPVPDVYESSYSQAQSYSNEIFVSFVNPKLPIFARLDFDSDSVSTEDAPYIKVSQPLLAPAGKTTVVNMNVDPAAFALVTSNLYVGPDAAAKKQYLDGKVSVWMNPVLKFAEKSYSLGELISLYPHKGVDNKIFEPEDQDPFTFRAEKNMTYRLEAVENYDGSVRPLIGFLPYSQDFVVADAAEMSNDIILSEGRSFYGRIVDDAGPKTGVSVGVKFTSIYNEYDQNFEYITRQGLAALDSEGRFRVAGVKSGRYRVELILDRLATDTTKYTSQKMPIMTREIFVGEDADTGIASPTTIDFNLKVSEIGWLDCKVTDENGNSVVGALAEIRNTQGEVVFYCSTNDNGALKTPESELIPLENGAYNVFIVGIATNPASFTYNFSSYDSLASVQIYPNNQVTPAVVKLQRAFPFSGTLKEGTQETDAQPVQYAQLRFEDSRRVNTYVMTDDEGKFNVVGLFPGDYRYFVEMRDGGFIKFYSGSVTILADQANVKDIVLLSSAQKQVVIQAMVGDQPLSDAGGQIILFSDATLRFKADHWYIAWPWAGTDGKMTISLPPLNNASYAYGFQGYERSEYITDPVTQTSYQKTYTPPALTMLDLAASAPISLAWKAPVTVEVAVANVPDGQEAKYLGVLVTSARFAAGRDANLGGDKEDSHEQNRDKFFAVLNADNKFIFNNMPAGQEYVFLVYEAFADIDPQMVQYTWDFPVSAMFRHASLPFTVTADLVRNETLLPLADLKLSCLQDPSVFSRPQALQVYFTGNAMNTIGNTGWPFINGIYNNYEFFPSVIKVPVGHALRLVYKPENGAQFLPRVVENFIVPTDGRDFELLLGEQAKVSGVVNFIGQPVEGQLVLIPDGANPLGENFQPHRVAVTAGSFNDYLNPGYYMGYAVPFTGGPATFIELNMASLSQALPPINIDSGVAVRGRVVTGSTVFGVSVMVLRKKSPKSELADGQQFYPYPVMNGVSQIPCGPMGDFYFMAEKNVDYYLQTIVPAGFTPAKMEKISVLEQEVVKDLTVGVGSTITGTMNVAGWAEAVPVGTSAEAGQVGMPISFKAQANIASESLYPFTFVGLDPAMLYDVTFWPMDGSKSYKKLINIPGNKAGLEVKLGDGFKIIGQLRDVDGNPLYMPNVRVNLAMIMPAMTMENATWTTMLPPPIPTDPTVPVASPPYPLDTPTVPVASPPYPLDTPTVPVATNSYYSIRQNVRALDTISMPASFSFENAMTNGMEVQTNELGQFTFNNVPDFLLAFIKTEKGFAVDGVSYGVARTANFVPGFVDGVMIVNLKVPVGGRMIGRVIDDTGKPVLSAWVEAFMGQNYAEAGTNSDGNFAIEGMAPGSNYMLSLGDMPGFAPVTRSGLLVEPGKTTDLGTLVVSRAVYAFGVATGSRAIKERSFKYGMQENSGVSIVAIDGNRALTDEDLISGKYAQALVGDTDLYLVDSDEVGFGMQVKPGKISAGVMLWRDSDSGFETIVSWGWKTGLVVPTQDQIGTGTFEISSSSAPILFPQKFGNIEGSLKHASDTALMFNPEDAVIALYPASGTAFAVTPFPAVMTRAINGKWFVRDVPVGNYRLKVISRKYGVVIDKDIISIAADVTTIKDVLLESAVKKITGRVVLASDKSKVASAKVALVLKNLSTSTNSEGVFEFYLPEKDLFIPQLEISKPGIKTTRIATLTINASEIASKGVVLTSDLLLDDIEVSGSVGSVEVVVKSGRDNKIFIGAEVAMVYKDPGSVVFTIGETQITNENGVARFLSVPLNSEVKFRARAHYHNPKTETLASVNGNEVVYVTMEPSKPRVFYTGLAELDVNDPTKVKVNALFDFDQVVETSAVKLFISGNPETGSCKYPDQIGTRFTSMTFNGLVAAPAEGQSLVASVTYLDSQIGSFSMMTRSVFRREYAVDPLSQDGFTGRQTDATGNILPTGISVPPGYLDPEIGTFKLEVASASVEQQTAKLEDAAPETVVKIAGPVFSFTFGEGDSHAGGDVASSTGLFEITIAYEEGTNLEPRWYDAGNRVWSKVGIIEGSVNKDYPQPGYVTFKVSHLTDFVVFENVVGGSAGIRWDFNGDGRATLADLAIGLAYYLAPDPDSISLGDLTTNANAFYSKVNSNTPALIKPSAIADDLNNDQRFSLNDIALFLAWYLAADPTATGDIEEAARGFYGNLKGGLENTPGTSVSR